MASFNFDSNTGGKFDIVLTIDNGTGLFSVIARRSSSADWPIISPTDQSGAKSSARETVYNPWWGQTHFAWAFCTYSSAANTKVYLQLLENGVQMPCTDQNGLPVAQQVGLGVDIFTLQPGQGTICDFAVTK